MMHTVNAITFHYQSKFVFPFCSQVTYNTYVVQPIIVTHKKHFLKGGRKKFNLIWTLSSNKSAIFDI